MVSIDRLRELEETEELLIKVCMEFDNAAEDVGIVDIPGLVAWWAKHKPKTDREKKLEKIKTIINKSGTYCVDDRCEEILKALEE